MRGAPARNGAGVGGWSLFETMVAIGLVATALMVIVEQLSISFRESSCNENRAFAYQRAASILGEIQNAIALGLITRSTELDALADQDYQVVLTTRHDDEGLPFAAGQPMSGNFQRQGHWMWSRKIHVEPAVEAGLYIVRVEMFHWTGRGWEREATQALQFSLLPSPDAPEQVFDVYLLACAAAPALSGDLAELRTQFDAAASSIATQSQAALRLHWITRLGYGRDPCYAPFVNMAAPADVSTPYAYWLPGQLGGGSEGSFLYRADAIDSLCLTETGLAFGRTQQGTTPVTVADQNNHCMRTPAARALFDQRVAAGVEREDEPPLQLLLDDLASRPERYRNALFVNLHGPGLPMPPLRNFADAARDPEHQPGVRVVTHPARLQTPRDPNGDGNHADTQPLELRVYAWRTQGSGDVLTDPILVQIYGPDLTSAINAAASPSLQICRLPGGIDTKNGKANGTGRAYVGFDETGGTAPVTGEDTYSMHYEAGFVGGPAGYTWLKLYDTPLVAPQVGTRGLPSSSRLYGLEYCPAPPTGTFAHDLAHDNAAAEMRNTARWRIRIPSTVFTSGRLPNSDQVVRVVTRIGASTATGIRWPAPVEPLDVSETFAWWSRSSNAVPVTERCQFLGDPRLCPYSDLMAGSTTFAHGYNWHFDDLVAGKTSAVSQWPCFDGQRLDDGFGTGNHADVPRFLQMLRQGLQNCGGAIVLPFGRAAGALLLGGEIAFCPGGVEQAVALPSAWTGGQTTSVDTVTPGSSTGTRILTQGKTFTWWAQPWLGELFPDDQWASWYATGNLPLGTGKQALQWQLLHKANPAPLPTGTAFDKPQGAAVGDAGAALLLDCGNRNATFLTPDASRSCMECHDSSFIADHGVPPSLSARPSIGQNEINTATNLVPPASVASGQEITLMGALSGAPCFDFTDTYPRSTVSALQSLWVANGGSFGSTQCTTSGGGGGGGGISLGLGGLSLSLTGSSSDASTGAILDCAQVASQRAFFVPWVFGGGGESLRDLAEQSLLAGIRALHVGGTPSLPGRVAQLPRLEIIEPQSGTSLPPDGVVLRWKTDWQRFDGQPYTSAYPTGFAESEAALVYRILWSADGGSTWTSALNGAAATPGVWPDATDCIADTSTGTESYTVASASSLPDGEYLFLVEAWRSNTHCHSSSHRVKIMLNHAAGPGR